MRVAWGINATFVSDRVLDARANIEHSVEKFNFSWWNGTLLAYSDEYPEEHSRKRNGCL